MSLDPYPSNEQLLRIKAERDAARWGKVVGPIAGVVLTRPQPEAQPATSQRPRRSAIERMNKTEKAFAQRLEAQRRNGEIASWDFEAITFKLGHDCRYTPDFMVRELDDTFTFHETKGFMRDDALVKLRTFAKQYGLPIHVWKRKQGQWTSTDFTHSPSISPLPKEAQ